MEISKIKVDDPFDLTEVINNLDYFDELFFDGRYLFVKNGRNGVKASISACGAGGAGSNPACGPISKSIKNIKIKENQSD